MKALTTLSLSLVAAAASATSTAVGADWPHWLGPNGDNIAPPSGPFEPDLSRWSEAWKANVGRGYSSVIVSGGRAYTLGHDEKSQETVTCLDAKSGDIVWTHAYKAELLPKMHPGGPNASPTVDGDRVITLSKDGQVFCLAADSGKEIWKASLETTLGIKLPAWGYASSAVVDEGRVLFSAGKVVALDRDSGKALWTSANTYHPGYTTPVVFQREGRKFLAALDGKGLSVLSSEDGKEIARIPFKAKFDMVATTPIVLTGGSRIFISGNTSAAMLAFDGSTLSEAWSSENIRNTMNNSVAIDGLLFGIDGSQGSAKSSLTCIDASDGSVKWTQEKFGYGNTIGIGKAHLLALTENGELVTLKAGSKYEEISRRQLLGKTCWTTPVYAAGRIFVRNDRGNVVCLAKE